MELHDIKQGSPEWLSLRQNYFTASEATAMMGDSPYTSRDQLLHQKKTGSTPEVTEHQQRQFDRGHAAEAGARPLLEKGMVGEDLFPVTGTLTVEGLPLLASFDGLTMDKTLVFEHKLWNEKLVAQIEGEGLEPTHYWQLEHQLLVSGAERVLFVSSDGTAENFRYVYCESQDHRRDALIAGWHQFKADLETFQPQAPEPVLVGELIPECMDLMAGIRGQVIQSNLAELEHHIQHRIHQTKKELVSDQDFLDAESAVKFFSNTEKKLKDGKKNLLSQVPDIKKLFADIDHLAKAMANVRLPLDKKSKALEAEP
ncbi:YqaJ viral recombinase family protein [Endozoicomonas acroporae]|uniref:YqaJ viral recombinase family protein n=1 Tax=Endozoicomonas acroporae TaxID=1701104 RepID=UPI0013D09C8C|nr:YqaJ viral recombinase family protein [Endozoicomonas acroporae]